MQQSEQTLKSGQVLSNIKHGGHILEDKSPQAAELARKQESITLAADAVGDEDPFETKFDYLFLDLTTDPAAHLPADDPATVVTALKALGDAMVEDSLSPGEDPLQPTENSTIPPVYTYWGQFIDHDLTANTDRDSTTSDITVPNLKPLPPEEVVMKLKNLRQPTVNLDSVYGDGPTVDSSNPTRASSFYDGIKFKVGTVATNPPGTPEGEGIPGDFIPPDGDLQRDLPRVNKIAQIADARNDENLIIAQLHTAFLRFHNAVVDWLQTNEPSYKGGEFQLFERARQLTRWHHQWLVVHDYLKTITIAGIPDKILLSGPKHYAPRNGEPFMPLEFSVAAYRFGHTMVRAAYDHNRNFGRPGRVIPNASFDLLFAFTGNGFTRDREDPTKVIPNPFLGQTDVLPFNWIIEWDRFVNKGSFFPDHFARKIDTRLAPPLKDMVNEGNDEPDPNFKIILKRLARRNLLRGYLLNIPTGQSVAKAMGVDPLSSDELRLGNSGSLNQVLEENGFLNRTPLWFYVLKESEVRANGNSLGELGSRIICETIIGQILNDPESYLSQKGGWDPSQGVKLSNGDPIVTIGDFIQFAGIPA
ncbi:hypothetical protein H6F88_01305 [Oculatella sp. FACHB-28]|nr:hypothetical protein [Oculatella sp. FACHB-28]